jgi:hypothetical protein
MIDLATARDRLQHTFNAAAAEREKRPGYNAAAGTFDWVLYEREQMHLEVNRIRAGNGLEPADEAALLAAESTAKGHSDYAAKFALRCADLAVR